jgi:putative peptidoglycan lipid II flippase
LWGGKRRQLCGRSGDASIVGRWTANGLANAVQRFVWQARVWVQAEAGGQCPSGDRQAVLGHHRRHGPPLAAWRRCRVQLVGGLSCWGSCLSNYAAGCLRAIPTVGRAGACARRAPRMRLPGIRLPSVQGDQHRMKSPSMFRGLLSFSAMTLISRVLGLVRDMSINAAFGASGATDAFWVAFRVPNFLRRLFAEGSFSTAFVPVFTQVKETRSHAELKVLMAQASGTLGGVLLLVTALGILFAPQVTVLFSPGALDEPEKFGLTVDLLRLTFPFLLFVSLTALCGGALNSFQRFALPALTPVILNLCMIGGALWLSRHMRTPIMAMGWAILLAGILQLLFQLPALRGLNLLTLPRWGWAHPDVRRIMRLMVPTLFGSSVAQINLLFDTVIASYLILGSQTWLSQADRFLELPLGLFGVALGTVILPSLSRHFVAVDHGGFSRALDWALRLATLIALPAMFGLMLLAEPLVAAIFQHGRWTAHDTDMATLSITALSFGLPAFALV